MTKTKILLLVLFIASYVQAVSDAQREVDEPVIIQSIKTDINKEDPTRLSSSARGGQTLFMKVTGLDPTPSNNKITVGPYPCIIAEKGVSDVFLNCITTDIGDTTDVWWKEVRVWVKDKTVSRCTATQCLVNFENTPKLYFVHPKSMHPDSVVTWKGDFNTNDKKDIEPLLIGDTRCHRFEEEKKADDDDYIHKSGGTLRCKVSSDISAGFYGIRAKNQYGWTQQMTTANGVDVESGSVYQAKVLPIITKLGQNQISSQGGRLTVEGKGFGKNVDEIEVFYNGVKGNVLSIEKNEGKAQKDKKKKEDQHSQVLNVELPRISGAYDLVNGDSKFIGGVGLEYTIYPKDRSVSDLEKFRTAVRDGTIDNLKVLDEGKMYETEVIEKFGDNYVQYIRGYFLAPRTGSYTFYMTGDDQAELWLSNVPDSRAVDDMEFLLYAQCCHYRNYWKHFYDDYYGEKPNSISKEVVLTAGDKYFMEIFYLQGGGHGYFTASVEIPSEEYQYNSQNEIQKIQIKHNGKLEKMEFKIYNNAENKLLGGQYYMKFQRIGSTRYLYNRSSWHIYYDAHQDVERMWSVFRHCFYWYTEIERHPLDKDGNILPDNATEIAGYVYTVTYVRHREDNKGLLPIFEVSGTTGSVTYDAKILQVPDDTISGGSFKLQLNGQFINAGSDALQWDLRSHQLAYGVNKLYPTCETKAWSSGTYKDGMTLYFQCGDVTITLPEVQVIANDLISGTTTSIETSIHIPKKKAQLFEPIPSDLIYLPQDKPQLQIRVKNIHNVCKENACDLERLTDVPKVETFEFQQPAKVVITYSNEANYQFNQNDLDITLGQSQCSVSQLTSSSLECNLPTVDGQVVLEAGKHLPKVNIRGVGYMRYGSLTQYLQELKMTSVTPDRGSQMGGTEVTIKGQGFPMDVETKEFFKLRIDGQNLEISEMNNHQVVAKMPYSEGTQIEFYYNGQRVYIPYTYDPNLTIQLHSLSARGASPYSKDWIAIYGKNFGTKKEDIKAFLQIKDTTKKKYDLKVETVKDDEIVVKLQGGKSARYDVFVERKGMGYSYPNQGWQYNDFEYFIAADNMTPNEGSIYGGTVVTITGRNFYPDVGSTYVVLGDVPNNFCNILYISETEIRCKMPPQHSSYDTNTAIKINVITRLVDYAYVNNRCSFTYTHQMTPTIDSFTRRRILMNEEQMISSRVQHTFIPKDLRELRQMLSPYRQLQSTTDNKNLARTRYVCGRDYSITGTGFGTAPILHFGREKITTFIEQTDTLIRFKCPYSYAGDYLIQVENPEKGYASQQWIGYMNLNAWRTTPNVISQGGQIIEIHGQSFDLYPVPTSVELKIPGPSSNEDVFIQDVKIDRIENVSNWQRMFVIVPSVDKADFEYKLHLSQKDPYSSKVATSGWINMRFTASAALTPQIQKVIGELGGQGTDEYPYIIEKAADFTIKLTGIQFPEKPDLYFENKQGRKVSTATILSSSATEVVGEFSSVEGGFHKLVLVFDGIVFGYFTQKSNQFFMVKLQNPTATQVQSSYLGGQLLKIEGTGFSAQPQENVVSLCGQPCPVEIASEFQIECRIPSFNTENTYNAFSFNEDYEHIKSSSYTVTTDTKKNKYAILDGDKTTYYQSSNSECFVDLNFGENKLQLQQFRYVPRIDIPSTELIGSEFQISEDGKTYKSIFEINSVVHAGWNFEVPTDKYKNIKAIRYYDSTGTSGCQLAEFQVYGRLEYQNEVDLAVGKKCTAKVSVNGVYPSNAYDAVFYNKAATPVVNEVKPKHAPTNGGTLLTINGQRFANTAQVLVDGVECQIQSLTSTQITCITGDRNVAVYKTPAPSFEVLINGNKAAKFDNFFYANKFSEEITWGGDIPPREMDSIFVPPDETLIIDKSPPKLYAILVQGNLLFDEEDIDLDAHYIVVSEGRLTIGTEMQPRQSKLTITMHGNVEDKQLPEFGNKVIACHQCTLDIHGKKRNLVWTDLATTAEIGDTKILLSEKVDWQVGEEIVIAATQWNHLETERRFITRVDSDQKTLHFKEPLDYRHFSDSEPYGTKNVPMRAEVGLLSRNIVIQGDENSLENDYGAHLIIHGKIGHEKLLGRIEYAEFRKVGQPKILGRYPIHFHMNGEMFDSYVRGNAIHDSAARCVTIHGTHFLRVQNNVGYNHKGHGIFMEDGIETNNLIQGNLILGARQTWIMLQKDITVSTYWITNPYNTVIDNRSGGSEWYGFWYEIKEHPDGPSARSDICPTGLQMKEFSNNIAHSNGRFGLRILEMAPRKYPCEPYRDDTLDDPFSANPTYPAVFENFVTFSNHEVGVLGEILGTVIFKNMSVVDSKLAGFQSHKTNLTKEGAKIQDFLIVGRSRGNAQPKEYYDETRAVIAPRTDGFFLDNVKLFNFEDNMILFQSASINNFIKKWVTGGKNTLFRNIEVDESAKPAKKIFWQKHRREIFWDLDGSLTKGLGGEVSTSNFLSPYKETFEELKECTLHRESIWNDTVICDGAQTQVRDVLINHPLPHKNFEGVPVKFYRLGSSEGLINEEAMHKIKASNDQHYSYATPLATGYTYNVHWNRGIDFEHVDIQPSGQFTPEDKGIVLRFNYTAQRENFNIGRLRNEAIQLEYTNIGEQPDPSNCKNGQWWNDVDNEYLYICLSGKNILKDEFIDIDPVICEGENCLNGVGEAQKESTPRYWSKASDWPLGKVPVAGEDVIINGEWTMILDVETPILGDITVDGHLDFDDSKPSVHLQAKKIWVRAGKINVGKRDQPYKNQAQITLHGQFDDEHLLIDEFIEASNKVLAVTNQINLYGFVPGSVWTRLTSFAKVGTNSIQVLSADGWKVGDEVVIGPSGMDPQQHERFKIVQIAGTTITLDANLKYNHFGAPDVTIKEENIGEMDMRALVGHLTRNVKISGSKDTDWGCRVMITQFKDNQIKKIRRGSANIQGVEFDHCGQFDTERGGLNFFYLNGPRVQSIVRGNSFHDSEGQLLNAVESHDIKIENNIFYNGVKILASMIEGHNNQFMNNALIFVRLRDINTGSFINWASLGYFVTRYGRQYTTIDAVQISGNIGQGSEDTGFIMLSTSCYYEKSNGIFDNTVSSVIKAGFAFRQTDGSCSIIQDVKAFHCGNGLQATYNAQEIRTKRIMLAENKISIKHKAGLMDNYDNPHDAQFWFVSAVARPNCPECYTADLGTNICQNQVGYQMSTQSSSSFPPPLEQKTSSNMDSICTIQKIDGRLYMNNIVFDNFKQSYENLPNCKNNNIFKQHGAAPDMTCSHYLRNTVCRNCDKESKFALKSPNKSNIGWFGGCGSFECTGDYNILIHDQDGSFLGTPRQVISNNPWFGSTDPSCTKISSWNAFECSGENIAVMNWMSIAPDYRDRLFSPVYLEREDQPGKIYNMVNSLKEWQWDGPEPMNARESKFIALVHLYEKTLLKNEGMNPSDYHFWLHKRSRRGSSRDWLIIKHQYTSPQALQIQVGTKVVNPFPVKEFKNADGTTTYKAEDLSLHYSQCGANNYFYHNNTIEFVVNADKYCLVRLRQVNNIVMNLHINLDIDQFFAKIEQALPAFLGIEPYNLKTSRISGKSIQILVDGANAIGDCNMADCSSDDAGYDPSIDVSTQNTQMNTFQNRQSEFANSLDSYRTTEDPVDLGIEGMQGQVSKDYDYVSTEMPNTEVRNLYREGVTLEDDFDTVQPYQTESKYVPYVLLGLITIGALIRFYYNQQKNMSYSRIQETSDL